MALETARLFEVVFTLDTCDRDRGLYTNEDLVEGTKIAPALKLERDQPKRRCSAEEENMEKQSIS